MKLVSWAIDLLFLRKTDHPELSTSFGIMGL
ncbi:hypothetical protein T09_12082 [Trichinella sp. T9]|nr:hypothetical protein T09_7764 [Trichinella sp. T9]KRX46120.1 hypothetical protein T09_12082 [Trichinella sp. T9]